MTTIFDGKSFAEKIELEISKKVLNKKITPHLAAISIGNDKASKIYLTLKQKAAGRIGATVKIHDFGEISTEKEVLQLIKVLNTDSSVHGIMIQLPVPVSFNKEKLFSAIDPTKDVDGQSPDGKFVSATVLAISKIIESTNVGERASVVVVGEDGEVGKRLVKVLRDNKYSVMGVDINTQNPLEVTRMADVLVTVTGKPHLVTDDWVKKNAVVIDVGAPLPEVDFAAISQKASFITPVPGGVGPVTVACLLENLVEAAII